MKANLPLQHKIAFLGAYDRFNYGDLLFPIIAGNEMRHRNPGVKISVHALIESDLSKYGALKTQSLRALYARDALQADDVVVFVGGGVIGVDWTYMLQNLVGRKANEAIYYATRLVGGHAVNQLSRFYFGGRSPFPWVAGPEHFPVPVSVAYNAVGGSELAKLPPFVQKRTLRCLEKAAYLSVRDAETKRLMMPVEGRVAVELAPDSAVIMSEQYPLTLLEGLLSSSVRQQITGEPYVCFHANLNYIQRFEDRIVPMLEAIFRNHGLRALLLPIGRYVGLDDQVGLRSILEKIRTPATMVSDQASIWDIMAAIARAKLFLGTSLHGNVTSQSFAVPHLGLSERPSKLDFYLQTWDLPEQAHCIRLEDSTAQVARVLAVPEAARLEKQVELLARSHENFAQMMQACGL